MQNSFDDKTIIADEMNKSTDGTSPEAKQTLLRAKLVCMDDSFLPDDQKGLVIDLADSEMILGRGENNDIVIKSKKISRQHARIYPAQDTWGIEDLKSTNGVMINNKEITNQLMHSGDSVLIGTIPFRFEVELPESAAVEEPVDLTGPEEEPETEKTMLFGDLGASQAILEADQAEEEEAPPMPEPKKEKTRPAFQTTAQEKEKKELGPLRGILKTIVMIAVIVVLGGGGIYYYTSVYRVNKQKEQHVRQHTKDINQFVEESENYPLRFNKKSHEDDLIQLDTMLMKIEQDLDKFPGNTELESLELTVLFMRLEREAHFFVEENDPDNAMSRVKQAREKIAEYETKYKTEKSDAAKRIQEVAELVDLMEIVATYKIFEKTYPDPEKAELIDVSALKNEILTLNRLKNRFGELKKRNNKPLRVVFRYFGGMVDEVDERVLTLVDKWDRWALEKS